MDPRARQHRWYDSFDPRHMTITFDVESVDADGDEVTESVTVPARYTVCPVCAGAGTHVHPSVDAHGLSAEDFEQDPDFRDQYFAGRYDVPCACCGGDRVIPGVDETRATAEGLAQARTRQAALRRAEAERARELRRGY